MTCIPVPTDLAFRLLDETSRRRVLADDESLLLEQIVNQGHRTRGIRFKWCPKTERELSQASHRKGALRAFAAKHGVTEKACYERLAKLRARKADKTGKGEKG